MRPGDKTAGAAGGASPAASGAASGAGAADAERERVLFERAEVHGLAVVGDDEILPDEVADRVALLIRDVDLDELEDDVDLVLERLGRGLHGLGLERSGRGRMARNVGRGGKTGPMNRMARIATAAVERFFTKSLHL